MLKIINDLSLFFGDNYRRINVREYARIMKTSPPTASKLLEGFNREGILKREKDRNYIFYCANSESGLFVDLSRIYWKLAFESSGLVKLFEDAFLSPVVVLFGSLSKAEAKKDSDIDIAVFTKTKKALDLRPFEKKLKRKIQLFVFEEPDMVKNKELLKNILGGYKLRGHW